MADVVDLEVSTIPTHTDKTGIRMVSALIKELEVIEIDCNGDASRKYSGGSRLDDFQRYKRDLNRILKIIKQDIKTKRGIERRLGANAESIKLKSTIKANLLAAHEMQSGMEAAYNVNKEDLDSGSTELSPDEVSQREQLVDLMKQDLLYTEGLFNNNGVPPTGDEGIGGFKIARNARDRRIQQKEEEEGDIKQKEQEQEQVVHPLTAKQQAFIQESIERDALLDEKLEIIKRGVKTLGNIANDINAELEVQDVMLTEVDKKMGDVTDRLERRNNDIKAILDKSGGAARWCPVLILCIILMAAIGYIYNATTNDGKK